MLKDLVKLANHLDRIGLTKEADFIDNLLQTDLYDDCNNKSGYEYVKCIAEKHSECGPTAGKYAEMVGQYKNFNYKEIFSLENTNLPLEKIERWMHNICRILHIGLYSVGSDSVGGPDMDPGDISGAFLKNTVGLGTDECAIKYFHDEILDFCKILTDALSTSERHLELFKQNYFNPSDPSHLYAHLNRKSWKLFQNKGDIESIREELKYWLDIFFSIIYLENIFKSFYGTHHIWAYTMRSIMSEIKKNNFISIDSINGYKDYLIIY